MPIKSKAQRRKFAELLLSGQITPEQFERWNREAGSAELPEHVKPRRKRKTARKAKRKTARKVKRKTARKTKRKTARKAKRKTARKTKRS